MQPSHPDEQVILQQAAERARRLLENLVSTTAELEAFGVSAIPTSLPHLPSPGLVAEGEALLRGASESARRLANNLGAVVDASRPPDSHASY